MRHAPYALAIALAFAPLHGAVAQDAASDNGRYTMTPTADGFLRLDTRSGAVSLCTVASGAAMCRASAEERAALQDEIDRLARDNAALRQQTGQAPSRYGIPSDQDIDQALGVAQRLMKRFMNMLRDEPPR